MWRQTIIIRLTAVVIYTLTTPISFQKLTQNILLARKFCRMACNHRSSPSFFWVSVARKTEREQTTTGEHRRVQEPLSNGKSQNETNTSFQRSTTKRLRLGVKPTKLNLPKVSDTRMYWHTPGQGPIFSVACLFIKQMVQGTNRLMDNNKKERKKWTVNNYDTSFLCSWFSCWSRSCCS